MELQAPEQGTYVAVRFSDQTVSRLRAYQEENAIPNPLASEHFHSTIIYSRVPIEWTPETHLDIEARPHALHVWGTSSDTRCLVLEIESDYLQDRFADAIALGGTHDFDDYRPHVTLSYDVGNFDATKIDIPSFFLEITNEYKDALRE